jgi:DNA-binding NarL/FixJ family response regulator
VRLIIANDHEIIVRGLIAMLAPFRSEVEIVGTALGDHEILDLADETSPDLVLLDAFLRGDGGVQAAAKLLASAPDFRVVIFTYEEDARLRDEALRAGVTGYLLKSLDAARLVTDLQRVAEGELVVDPPPTSLAGTDARSGCPGAELGLSRREGEVLALLVEGSTNRQIAESLFVGEETVKSHLRSLYRKLGVRDRSSAVSVAWRRELFPR